MNKMNIFIRIFINDSHKCISACDCRKTYQEKYNGGKGMTASLFTNYIIKIFLHNFRKERINIINKHIKPAILIINDQRINTQYILSV